MENLVDWNFLTVQETKEKLYDLVLKDKNLQQAVNIEEKDEGAEERKDWFVVIALKQNYLNIIEQMLGNIFSNLRGVESIIWKVIELDNANRDLGQIYLSFCEKGTVSRDVLDRAFGPASCSFRVIDPLLMKEYYHNKFKRIAGPFFQGIDIEEQLSCVGKELTTIKMSLQAEDNILLHDMFISGLLSKRGYLRAQERVSLSYDFEDDSRVYLMRRMDRENTYKIGYSKYPSRRSRQLIKEFSIEGLMIVATTPGGRGLEYFLHQRYESNRISGEWFRFDDRQIKKVGAIYIRYNSIPRKGVNVDLKRRLWYLDQFLKDKAPLREAYEKRDLPRLIVLLEMYRDTFGDAGSDRESGKYPICPSLACWCYQCTAKCIETSLLLLWNDNKGAKGILKAIHKHPVYERLIYTRAAKSRLDWGWQLEEIFNPRVRTTPTYSTSSIEECSLPLRERVIETKIAEDRPFVQVTAKWIGNNKVAFECPFCMSSYHVSGEPEDGSKSIFHYYPSILENLHDNFALAITPPCSQTELTSLAQHGNFRFPNTHAGFLVLVTDETARKVFIKKKTRLGSAERKIEAFLENTSIGFVTPLPQCIDPPEPEISESEARELAFSYNLAWTRYRKRNNERESTIK